ncbi:DUF1831 domain-containing protein [Oenococcus kitaharae]|uniref:Cysteine desulfurase n=1 Tax=Oenococcus kitaharae DSM 17330 TaxID=1045004 RepID=G9WFR9_9LACO|nr:DUF1831 domain-containing protein [Oenococcus kitaharae]EHN59442.1 hypothetical protein OKIT_1359 [Oenococcus kitaharae DSM 17330]MCV3295890.1 DUF1831 domain-containing protein [Oenococcus kitaharae]OEY83311.1 hypothetical protein NT95_04000 [Oenococcus kitaharae]OEY85109.1 hypothetical protein NT96_00440 [Oenococcus kitaharae]OEY85964.1 hypothetical protein NV75_00390 [Oenococcus kitaharae]
MAFSETVSVKGDQTYRISPSIKAFTLRDLGFFPNNAGALTKTTLLEPEKGTAGSRKLKLVFAKDVSGFKVSILTANEALNVDIFSNDQDQPLVEQYRYQIQQLIDRNVLETV